jgi:hypothetical protein
VLRRGTALGAAVALATPIVQGVGKAAAFAQVSPPPGEAAFPSHFQVIFTANGDVTFYGIKWDGSWGTIGGPPYGAGSRCWDDKAYRGVGYVDATADQMAIFASKASIGTEVDHSGAKGAYVLDVSGLTAIGVQIVDAATFDGGFSGGYSEMCDLPISPSGDGLYRFWKG